MVARAMVPVVSVLAVFFSPVALVSKSLINAILKIFGVQSDDEVDVDKRPAWQGGNRHMAKSCKRLMPRGKSLAVALLPPWPLCTLPLWPCPLWPLGPQRLIQKNFFPTTRGGCRRRSSG